MRCDVSLCGSDAGSVSSGKKGTRRLLESLQHHLHRCTGLHDPSVSTRPERSEKSVHPIRTRLHTVEKDLIYTKVTSSTRVYLGRLDGDCHRW